MEHCLFVLSNTACRQQIAVTADQIVGDVFANLLEHFSASTGPIANLRPYLFEIAYHLFVNELRYSHHRVSIEAVDFIVTDRYSTLVSVENRMLFENVRRAIMNDLTQDQQHVIILRFLEGFRIKETALIIGKKVNNVKVIQNRAIAPICAFFWLDQSPLFRTLHIRHDFEIAEISSSDNGDIEFTFVNSRSNENMESTTYRGTVIAQRGQYICIVPTTSASIPIGSLGYGSNVTTELKQDGWWHLTRINGAHRHLPVDTGFDLANAEYIICQTCDDQKACGNYS